MSRRLLVWSVLVLAGLSLLVCVLIVVTSGYLLSRQVRSTPQPTPGSESGTPVPAASWYHLYFTNPRYPDRPEYHHGGIDEKLVAFIDQAQRSLDVADYDFDLESVAQAMARAKQRGVTVRMVTDSDTLGNKDKAVQAAFDVLKKAGIPIVPDNRGPIMHDKFVVRDSTAVWTGSWNFTDGDTYRLNNNAIEIQSPRLAANYTAEFQKMFLDKKFGPNKPKGVPNPKITIDGATIETYFAPQDKISEKIVARVQSAKQSIYFLAFSFTDDAIGNAIIERAKAGVKVAGVFENTGSETRFSEFGPMKQAGLEVYQDGNPYVMHHKVIIIDEHLVLFGSYNFSSNADSANDENILFVDDAGMAAKFIEEFNRVREVAKNPPK